MSDPHPEPAPDAAATAVADAVEGLLSWVRRATPPDGISLTAVAALTRIARGEVSGVSALAAVEGVGQPAMSQMLTRLERDGLVRRERARDDGRRSDVALTAAGQRVVDSRRAARTRALAELLARADAADAALVAAALPALARLTRPPA